MKQALTAFIVLVIFIASCKKEEPAPQPVVWNEDWCLFKATFIDVAGDTSHIAVSSNQGYQNFAQASALISIYPWQSKATYTCELGGPPGIKLERGVLLFNGINWDDLPEDSDFIDYFRSGYYRISENVDSGFNVIYTDPDGWIYSTSAYAAIYGGNYSYTCRISDYHPFVRNGIQYVKVRMLLNGLCLYGGGQNTVLRVNDMELECYFRNE